MDTIVLDINIFKYYKKSEQKIDTSAAIDIFEVFQPTNYKVAFINEAIRDDFNAGLKELRDSGDYQKIINSYIQ